jgi:hypothetical protein
MIRALALALATASPAFAQYNANLTAISVPVDKLERLTGEYRLAEMPDFPFVLSVKDGNLFLATPVEADFIYALSETKFFARSKDAILTFTLDEVGKGAAITFDQADLPRMVAKRTG